MGNLDREISLACEKKLNRSIAGERQSTGPDSARLNMKGFFDEASCTMEPWVVRPGGTPPVANRLLRPLRFSLAINPPEMGVGQVELAAGIRRESKTQTGLVLESDVDVELDLMLTPLR